jgi:hypothetical protein
LAPPAAVERTVVDVLHRPELVGGAEEVLKSLDLVRYLNPAVRSALPTTSWRACGHGFHDRNTMRWALNLVMPCSSSRGACFSLRRRSTPPLKASDGRVARTLQDIAAERQLQPATLERVIRLIDILDAFGADTLIGLRLALKGGTALNVFHSDLDCLSVEIDVNYVGAIEKEQMDADRPRLLKNHGLKSSSESEGARDTAADRAGNGGGK